MARIEGVDLPRNKRIVVALTYIFGVGHTTSNQILEQTGIDPSTRVYNLSEDQVQTLREALAPVPTEGDLRRQINMNIKRLSEIGSYRGSRHRHNLPVHGQRTRTNGRTRRGPRKTVPGRGRRRGAAK